LVDRSSQANAVQDFTSGGRQSVFVSPKALVNFCQGNVQKLALFRCLSLAALWPETRSPGKVLISPDSGHFALFLILAVKLLLHHSATDDGHRWFLRFHVAKTFSSFERQKHDAQGGRDEHKDSEAIRRSRKIRQLRMEPWSRLGWMSRLPEATVIHYEPDPLCVAFLMKEGHERTNFVWPKV